LRQSYTGKGDEPMQNGFGGWKNSDKSMEKSKRAVFEKRGLDRDSKKKSRDIKNQRLRTQRKGEYPHAMGRGKNSASSAQRKRGPSFPEQRGGKNSEEGSAGRRNPTPSKEGSQSSGGRQKEMVAALREGSEKLGKKTNRRKRKRRAIDSEKKGKEKGKGDYYSSLKEANNARHYINRERKKKKPHA